MIYGPTQVTDPEGLGRRVGSELGSGLERFGLLGSGSGGSVGGSFSLGCEVRREGERISVRAEWREVMMGCFGRAGGEGGSTGGKEGERRGTNWK